MSKLVIHLHIQLQKFNICLLLHQLLKKDNVIR